jgi:hypothetical protein
MHWGVGRKGRRALSQEVFGSLGATISGYDIDAKVADHASGNRTITFSKCN